MIVQHEIIEQVMDEPLGHSVVVISRLLDEMGRDAVDTLDSMRRAGLVDLVDVDGLQAPEWLLDAWADRRDSGEGLRVVATEAGLRAVFD